MTTYHKKILLIDDEPDILSLLKQRLEAYGLECVTAETAMEGLQLAATIKPNLILLDLMLPKMSGYGFLREIKSDPKLASIPVIVLTALGNKEVAREAMDLGAVGYLVKSCDFQEILTVVRNYT